MQCKKFVCSNPIPPHLDRCPVCGTDAGVPNVRTSESESEIKALEDRYEAAIHDAVSRGCQPAVLRFQASVDDSKAVIARPPSIAKALMDTDNALYVNYYSGIEAGLFMPRDNDWDRHRLSVDNEFFPHYHTKINFAALTLNDKGGVGYGFVSLVLRSEMISDRASVFEENTMKFFMMRKIAIGESIPSGYRATWENRSKLAVAKLSGKIDEETDEQEFPELLMDSIGSTESDFIEVHIYEKIHRRTVEKVSVDGEAMTGLRREDRVLVESLEDVCHDASVLYEVR